VRLGGTKVRLGGRYKVRLGATTLDRAGPKSDLGKIITFGRKSHTRKEIEAEVRLYDEALGKWKVESHAHTHTNHTTRTCTHSTRSHAYNYSAYTPTCIYILARSLRLAHTLIH
jgi:hypothetical protein